MSFFKRLKNVPLYIWIFLLLCLLDSWLFFFKQSLNDPAARAYWHELGNVFSYMLIFFAFTSYRGFRFFAKSIAVIIITHTLINYIRLTPPKFPDNPYLVFYGYQWINGVIWPLAIFTVGTIVKKDQLPIISDKFERTS